MIGQIINSIIGIFNKDEDTNEESAISTDKSLAAEEEQSIFDNNEENGINGEIDEVIHQGEYGDCWLISGVLTMSYTQAGAEVLKDSINLNSDGSVDVYFEGEDRKYNISADLLEAENEDLNSTTSDYSTGDDDMLAIELAVEEIVADDSVDTKYSIQDGGNSYYVYNLFGADSVKVANTESNIEKAFDYYEENSDDCSMVLGVVNEAVCGLTANHSYAVKSIDEDEVVLVDPWDTSEEITVDKESLLENYENLNVVYAEF